VNGGPAARAIGAILLDIEGTTTPIAYVKDVLFPYARAHLRSHLERQASSLDLQSITGRLAAEYAADVRRGETVPPWSVVAYVEWLMDRDRKSPALKELQGQIWKGGYLRGELVAEVFPDVPHALEHWHGQRIPAGIFSSGSVLAQQLLFRYSSAGDLTRFLRWYFDTEMGPKREAESYRRIARVMGCPSDAIIFVSDVALELEAAREAGMQVRLSMRPGNAPPPERHGFQVIGSLDGITAMP
jgi:enolase-phosphatase E1